MPETTVVKFLLRGRELIFSVSRCLTTTEYLCPGKNAFCRQGIIGSFWMLFETIRRILQVNPGFRLISAETHSRARV